MDNKTSNNNSSELYGSANTIAIILSAGVGKRLQPLTLETPKSLLKVGGLPILMHQLQAMKDCGVKKVILVLGYKSSMVNYVLLNSEYRPLIEIVENPDYESTNNLYSLYLALNYLEKSQSFHFPSRILLANGDVVFDKTILADMLKENKNQIAVDVGVYYDESMKTVLDNLGYVTKISKEIPQSEALGVSIDVYLFNSITLKDFKFVVSEMIEKENLKNAWTEHAMHRFFSETQHKFIPMNVNGRYWFEIDTLDDLKEAERRFQLSQKMKNLLDKKVFIFDLDGTVLLGNTVLPNVAQFLTLLLQNNKKIVFLTNNSSISKNEHLERLKQLFAIDLGADNIYTSVEDTINYLRRMKIRRLFLLATPSVREEFLANGFILESDKTDAIVVTFDRSLSYEKLERASLLLARKPRVPFILTNGDLKCPTKNGFIPDAGSIGRLLELVSGRKIDVARGKPNPEMIDNIILKQKMLKEDCVFFGDRLYTDIAMGDHSGVMTILMLTGETSFHELDLSFFAKFLVFNNYEELLDLITRTNT
jgi:HAD superfamily hydrolase (TIGR01450 family)